MTSSLSKAVLLIASLAIGEAALAAPILSGSGVLGLEQEGLIYDVEFGDRDGATYLDVVQDPNRAILSGSTFNEILLQIADLLKTSSLETGDIDGCESEFVCLIDFPVFAPEPGLVGGNFISYDPPNANAPLSFVTLSAGTASGLALTFGLITQRAEAAVPAPATLGLIGLGLLSLRLRRKV